MHTSRFNNHHEMKALEMGNFATDTLAGSWQTCHILPVRNQDVNVELLQTAISAT